MESKHTIVTLDIALSKRTVPELKELAKGYYVKGTSKMNKSELISAVSVALCNPDRLAELLFVIDEPTWKLIQRALTSTTPVLVNSGASEQCLLLADLGYLHIIEEPSNRLCTIPMEIKEVLAAMIADGFKKKKARCDLLHSYALAATNLYGVISQDDFVQLFNNQNQEHTSVEELFPVLLKHIAVDAPYCFWDEYIVCDEFEENDFKDVRDLLARVDGKPRYIPDKKEFLRYSDWDYFEQTDSTLHFEEYLCSQMGLSHNNARELITEIHFAVAVEANTQQIFNILYENLDDLSSTQFGEIAELVMNMSNSTRQWSNNGHTPEELSRLFRQPKLIQFPGQQKKQKIGRNDLCPCGSGKKYKKCCGR